MKRKKTPVPFDLRDPVVPEVRGSADPGTDILAPNGANTPSFPES